MELRQALAQVSEIREHLARTEVFRGYRSATVAFTGLVGVTAAILQASLLPRPIERVDAYLALWFVAAAINLAVVGVEIWCRARLAGMALARQTTMFAVGQFAPALVVGGLLTIAIVEAQAIRFGCCLACGHSCSVWASLPRGDCYLGLWRSWARGTLFAAFLPWHGGKARPRCRRGSWALRLAAGNF